MRTQIPLADTKRTQGLGFPVGTTFSYVATTFYFASRLLCTVRMPNNFSLLKSVAIRRDTLLAVEDGQVLKSHSGIRAKSGEMLG